MLLDKHKKVPNKEIGKQTNKQTNNGRPPGTKKVLASKKAPLDLKHKKESKFFRFSNNYYLKINTYATLSNLSNIH